VTTLLVDANLDGHAAVLDNRLRSETWREFREYLDIQFLQLQDVGLARTTDDDVIWRLCQERGFYLLTANRNMSGDDSLEATIRHEGIDSSLPVFTFGDADRLYESSDYVDQVADSLLTYLLNADSFAARDGCTYRE
jgi:hypothetical protein